MPFVIAYDISDPRRLRRVARFLERRAMRCQKSVFLLRASPQRVEALLDELLPLLDPSQDAVQAWELAPGQPLEGIARGRVLPLEPPCIVADPATFHLIQQAKP